MANVLDWDALILVDPLHAMEEIKAAMEKGEISSALIGLNEYIDVMSKQDVSTAESFVALAMAHIYKWNLQPDKRTPSWRATIENSRLQLNKLRKKRPSITREVIEDFWEDALETAKRSASLEMNIDLDETIWPNLTWSEVFDQTYSKSDIPPYFPH